MQKSDPSHSEVVVTKDNSLNFALNRIQRALNAASEERFQQVKEWERLAHKWEAEGDTHGMNFHQGMAAGANYVDIYYRRATREIDAIRSEQRTKSAEGGNNPELSQDSQASLPKSTRGTHKCQDGEESLGSTSDCDVCARPESVSAPPAVVPSCWHCGDVLADAPKLRCEQCPDECDTEGCDAMGCAATPVDEGEQNQD